ncbi:MAG: DUF4166 domain-containing protein [Pseudomonas sp.]|uniref:DUF4166 domain-containing protein n=1 Tax=Pseudomonas sp. TaxID=306 RepID=UPI003394F3C7
MTGSLHGIGAPAHNAGGEGELFKRILGERWRALHPDIQRRFECNPLPGQPLLYSGRLEELSCSFWGRLFGLLTWPLIKGALIPHTALDFPVDIRVYSKPACSHIFKERTYRLPGRKPILFTSHMKQSPAGEVLEYVGLGLGMKLRVFEQEHNLHFQSDGYFWDLGFVRVPVHAWLSPGVTYLSHVNEGPNQFRIRIDIIHPLLGRMFTQAGVFSAVPTP